MYQVLNIFVSQTGGRFGTFPFIYLDMNPIIKAYHCSSVPVCSLLLLIVPVGVVLLLLLLLLLMLLLVLLRRRRDDVEGGPVLLVPREHPRRRVPQVVRAHVRLARHRQLVLQGE